MTNKRHLPVRLHMPRRRFLKTCLGFALGTVTAPLLAAIEPMRKRALSLYNLHTGELLRTTYWMDGAYLPAELDGINRILRDFRTGEITPIDPQLIDLLFTLQQHLGTRAAVHVISAYRSPATNALLRTRSEGVAKHSLHMDGRAIDIRIPGCELAQLHRAAMALRAGGVGYYPRSDFVHLDTGRVRAWQS